MAIESTQIKFALSKQTGDIVGFVSRMSRTQKLKGVREDSKYGKTICVLSEDLKGKVVVDRLYSVELKQMHKGGGYVVISATPKLFNCIIKTTIISKKVYQVTVSFGNKGIYYDPMGGGSASSSTRSGVINTLKKYQDIDDLDNVIMEFKQQAQELVVRIERDGYILPSQC